MKTFSGRTIWVRIGKPEESVADIGIDDKGIEFSIPRSGDLVYPTNLVKGTIQFVVVPAKIVELLSGEQDFSDSAEMMTYESWLFDRRFDS